MALPGPPRLAILVPSQQQLSPRGLLLLRRHFLKLLRLPAAPAPLLRFPAQLSSASAHSAEPAAGHRGRRRLLMKKTPPPSSRGSGCNGGGTHASGVRATLAGAHLGAARAGLAAVAAHLAAVAGQAREDLAVTLALRSLLLLLLLRGGQRRAAAWCSSSSGGHCRRCCSCSGTCWHGPSFARDAACGGRDAGEDGRRGRGCRVCCRCCRVGGGGGSVHVLIRPRDVDGGGGHRTWWMGTLGVFE